MAAMSACRIVHVRAKVSEIRRRYLDEALEVWSELT
jgi:hypothetical protein